MFPSKIIGLKNNNKNHTEIKLIRVIYIQFSLCKII